MLNKPQIIVAYVTAFGVQNLLLVIVMASSIMFILQKPLMKYGVLYNIRVVLVLDHELEQNVQELCFDRVLHKAKGSEIYVTDSGFICS